MAEDLQTCLRDWWQSLRQNKPQAHHSLPAEVDSALLEGSVRDVRRAIQSRLTASGEWNSKGIYVWYWRPIDDRPAWPLYVGKSHRGASSFGKRLDAHLRHAASGKDFLYDPVKSWEDGRLQEIHTAGVSPDAASHSRFLAAQFSGLKVLLLPLHKEVDILPPRLVGDAEAMVLEAIIAIHQKRAITLPIGAMGGPWGAVMNSPGKTQSPKLSDSFVDTIESDLCGWMT